ncbi:uncharacterized protein BJ171DRAFT_112875 [Polychytrium aggregatum]|uniref:uncharacterized protein n=1 Tax=Polychytrium aggregatum TaxID=110093 RepID=UPI0022FE35BA|nr:uncharacterized protein BJ171DRAFT_112875 [Polychytrium aggregatum]KAI9209296.1 hypothetical protein BJ171DRAFT_112875 [Polychytrium aggregatum]
MLALGAKGSWPSRSRAWSRQNPPLSEWLPSSTNSSMRRRSSGRPPPNNDTRLCGARSLATWHHRGSVLTGWSLQRLRNILELARWCTARRPGSPRMALFQPESTWRPRFSRCWAAISGGTEAVKIRRMHRPSPSTCKTRSSRCRLAKHPLRIYSIWYRNVALDPSNLWPCGTTERLRMPLINSKCLRSRLQSLMPRSPP